MATLLQVLNNLADTKSAGGVLHFASELRAPDVAAIGRFAARPDLASVRPMPITPPVSS